MWVGHVTSAGITTDRDPTTVKPSSSSKPSTPVRQICLRLRNRRKNVRLQRFCNSLVKSKHGEMNINDSIAFLSRVSSCCK